MSSLDRIERGSKRYKSKGSRGINIREFTKHDRERAVPGDTRARDLVESILESSFESRIL